MKRCGLQVKGQRHQACEHGVVAVQQNFQWRIAVEEFLAIHVIERAAENAQHDQHVSCHHAAAGESQVAPVDAGALQYAGHRQDEAYPTDCRHAFAEQEVGHDRRGDGQSEGEQCGIRCGSEADSPGDAELRDDLAEYADDGEAQDVGPADVGPCAAAALLAFHQRQETNRRQSHGQEGGEDGPHLLLNQFRKHELTGPNQIAQNEQGPIDQPRGGSAGHWGR